MTVLSTLIVAAEARESDLHDIDGRKQRCLGSSTDSFVFICCPMWLRLCLSLFFNAAIFAIFHLTYCLSLSGFRRYSYWNLWNWAEEVERRKPSLKKSKQKQRDERIKFIGERERRKDGDNGEEKDSDHTDYGWTQQTGESHWPEGAKNHL